MFDLSFLKPAPLALLVLTTGCFGRSAPDIEQLQAEVQAADIAFDQAVSAGDVASFTDRVADDAVFLGNSISRGRSAIVEAWGPFLTPNGPVSLTWQPTFVSVARSGDLAYTLGDYQMRRRYNDGTEETLVGTYLTVWRRGDDGTWRAVADSGSVPQSTSTAVAGQPQAPAQQVVPAYPQQQPQGYPQQQPQGYPQQQPQGYPQQQPQGYPQQQPQGYPQQQPQGYPQQQPQGYPQQQPQGYPQQQPGQ